MLEEDRGVVLGVYVYRKSELYELQKPWNRGQREATPWEKVDAVETYYARFNGNVCSAYTTGRRRLFFPAWEEARNSPPETLPSFLGLHVLQDVPNAYRSLITE
jgi:hypothetical protein